MKARVQVAIAAVTVAMALSGCGAASGTPPGLPQSHSDVSSTSVAAGRLVITTWAADPVVTSGPYPGFRPQMTAFTPDMLTSISAEPDPNDRSHWDLTLTLSSAGAGIFRQISTNAYNACSDGPSTCPQNHLTDWLGLTQADIDNWKARADSLYMPYDKGGKLITDAYVQEPITGGVVIIQGLFSEQQAVTLARQLKP